MTFVVVTVVDDRLQRRDLELPLEIPMRELGPALAQALGVAELEQSRTQSLKPVLMLEDGKSAVPIDQSLASVGVLHGAILRFMLKPIPPILEKETALRFQGPGFVSPTGVTFHLQGDKTLIGRADPASGLPADVMGIDLTALDDKEAPSVSRRHAQVLRRNGDYILQDLDSTNGTILNDIFLQEGQRARLQHGDVVIFGDVQLAFLWDCQDLAMGDVGKE